jgi:hypothetical protein
MRSSSGLYPRILTAALTATPPPCIRRRWTPIEDRTVSGIDRTVVDTMPGSTDQMFSWWRTAAVTRPSRRSADLRAQPPWEAILHHTETYPGRSVQQPSTAAQTIPNEFVTVRMCPPTPRRGASAHFRRVRDEEVNKLSAGRSRAAKYSNGVAARRVHGSPPRSCQASKLPERRFDGALQAEANQDHLQHNQGTEP